MKGIRQHGQSDLPAMRLGETPRPTEGLKRGGANRPGEPGKGIGLAYDRSGREGFTLIELIVTIVIAAIALAAIIPFLSETFQLSHEPRVQLAHALDLQGAMENIVACHTNTLSNLKQWVGPPGSMVDGRFVVQENAFIEFVNGAETSTMNTNLLKITIRNELGETVTRLFSVPL